jgi:hypothetical protein
MCEGTSLIGDIAPGPFLMRYGGFECRKLNTVRFASVFARMSFRRDRDD